MRSVPLMLVVLCALPAVAQPPDVPTGIQWVYEEMWDAALLGRVRDARAYILAPMLYAMFGQAKGTNALVALTGQYTLQDADTKFCSCLVLGDRARVEYDLHLVGTDKRTGEESDITQRRVDWLLEDAGSWKILRSLEVDLRQEAAVLRDGVLQDPEFGLQVTVPDGWLAHAVVDGAPLTVCLLPSDPRAQISITAAETDEPEDGETDCGRSRGATADRMPDLGGTGSLVASGPAEFAGGTGYHSELRLGLWRAATCWWRNTSASGPMRTASPTTIWS